jgi:uncharacterized protein (DUF2336 family)
MHAAKLNFYETFRWFRLGLTDRQNSRWKRSGRAMSDTNFSIADEVEAAVAAGASDKCFDMMRRVTALFSASAANLSEDQVTLFGDVLDRLINTIELRALAEIGARMALAELSAQLAPIAQAPGPVVRRLARHDEISIAGPILSESARLSPQDLVEIAQSKGEPHLLAISSRWWLKEVVTDVLLARRFKSVSRRLIKNPGARISPAGFAIVLSQAQSDPELAVEMGIRVLRKATDAVRTRLLSRAPPHLFEDIRKAISAASASASREMSAERDFAAASHLVAMLKVEGRLDEEVLCDFARKRRYEETVIALAELSQSSVEVVRPLMQSLQSDGILVPCKVAGLSWKSVMLILDCRFSTGATSPDELARLKGQYAKLTAADARRLLRLWMVKLPSPAPRSH